jgi:hypothetical protein
MGDRIGDPDCDRNVNEESHDPSGHDRSPFWLAIAPTLTRRSPKRNIRDTAVNPSDGVTAQQTSAPNLRPRRPGAGFVEVEQVYL